MTPRELHDADSVSAPQRVAEQRLLVLRASVFDYHSRLNQPLNLSKHSSLSPRLNIRLQRTRLIPAVTNLLSIIVKRAI